MAWYATIVSVKQRSLTTEALVIKSTKTGEADKIITLLTQEQGKIVCVAKGVRKISSSKRAFLEPGNVVKAFLITTNSMPLLTQAMLIDDTREIITNLTKIRQLTQILEIVDKLFVEEEVGTHIFDHVLAMRQEIVSHQPTTTKISHQLDILLTYLGYQPLAETSHRSVLDYVQEITEKPMRSWEYLKV